MKKHRYLMCCVGMGSRKKLEEIVLGTSKRDASSIWLRRHKVVNFILDDCDGEVAISAERILTESEVKRREEAELVDGVREG